MRRSSLVSGGCIVSGAILSASLLFTGVRVNSYSEIEEAVVLPYVEVGRNARLNKVVIDRGVMIPEGLVVGEDPELDAKRFRRTEGGICLVTQADDRQLELTARWQHDVRSPRSRFRGIPADQDRWACRRGRCACRALGRRTASTMRTLVPGYPGVIASGGGERHVSAAVPDRFRRPARLCSARRVGDLDMSVARCAASLRSPGQSLSRHRTARTGPTMATLRRAQRGRRVRSAAARSTATGPTSSMLTTGRPALTPAYLRYDRRAGAPVRSSPFTILPSRATSPPRVFPEARTAAARPIALDGVEYYGGVGFLKAGLQFADAITTVSPTYAEKSRTPQFGMGLDGLIAARRQVLHGIVNGIDDRLWNPETDPHLAAHYRPQARRRAANKRAPSRSGSSSTPSDGPLFMRGQPPDLAKRHGPAGRLHRRHRRAGRPAGRSWLRRRGARGACTRARRAPSRPGRRHPSATTKRCRI